MHEMCTAANSHSNGSGINNTNNNNINDHTWNLLFTCCMPLPTAVSCALFPSFFSLSVRKTDLLCLLLHRLLFGCVQYFSMFRCRFWFFSQFGRFADMRHRHNDCDVSSGHRVQWMAKKCHDKVCRGEKVTTIRKIQSKWNDRTDGIKLIARIAMYEMRFQFCFRLLGPGHDPIQSPPPSGWFSHIFKIISICMCISSVIFSLCCHWKWHFLQVYRFDSMTRCRIAWFDWQSANFVWNPWALGQNCIACVWRTPTLIVFHDAWIWHTKWMEMNREFISQIIQDLWEKCGFSSFSFPSPPNTKSKVIGLNLCIRASAIFIIIIKKQHLFDTFQPNGIFLYNTDFIWRWLFLHFVCYFWSFHWHRQKKTWLLKQMIFHFHWIHWFL